MAYRSNRRRSSAPKRRMFWARRAELVELDTDRSAFTHNVLSDFESEYGADLFGFTVTRTRGHYTYWAPDQETTTTSFNLSAGLRVDDESEVTGSTETNSLARLPINDPHTDWMYARNNLGAVPGTGSTSPTPAEQISANRVELDLKSQRRMDELGQSLFFYFGLNAPPTSSGTVFMWYDLHVLCKRP